MAINYQTCQTRPLLSSYSSWYLCQTTPWLVDTPPAVTELPPLSTEGSYCFLAIAALDT